MVRSFQARIRKEVKMVEEEREDEEEKEEEGEKVEEEYQSFDKQIVGYVWEMTTTKISHDWVVQKVGFC